MQCENGFISFTVVAAFSLVIWADFDFFHENQ